MAALNPNSKETPRENANPEANWRVDQDIAAAPTALDQPHGMPTVLREQITAESPDVTAMMEAELVQLKRSLDEMKAELAQAKKTSVGQITIGKVEQMVQQARTTLRDGSQSMISLVKDNPVPSAMIGVGLGWLFVCSQASPFRTRSRHGKEPELETGTDAEPLRNGFSRTGQQASQKAGEVTHTLQRSVSEATERAERLAEQAQTTLNETLETAKVRVEQYKKTVQEQGRKLEGYVEQTFHDNPWVVGAAVLALGTTIGLAIPISRREEKWMGKARDSLVRQAGARAQDAIHKVEDAARRAMENAARQHGNGGNRTQSGSPAL